MSGTSTLSLTFTNPNSSISLSVDAGLTVQVPDGLTSSSLGATTTSTCQNGGAVTFRADGNGSTMARFTLTAGASCTITAPATGTTAGTFIASNSVGAVYAGISNTSTATLTVTSQSIPLTITANNAARAYGAANPAFPVTASGFVNTDTIAALGGTLICSTPATTSAPVGTYLFHARD